MKPEAGQFQIIQRLSVVDGIQNLQTPLLQIRPDFRAFAGFKQVPKSLLGK
jgi:hypothetical protein